MREPGPGAGSAPGAAGISGRADTPGQAAGRVPGSTEREGAALGEAGEGVLVIGYGNTLRTDDGVGVHAAALLAADPRVAGAEVLVLHQLGPELAEDLGRASLVVFVDASTEGPPGSVTVRRLAGGEPARGVPGTGLVPGTGGMPGAEGVPGAGGMPGAAADPGAAPGATSHHVGADELLALAAELYGAAPDAFVVSVGVADMEVGEALSPAVAAALPAVTKAIVELVAAHRRPPPAGE